MFGSYVYQSNYTAGLRILETAQIASGTLSEVAFFDIFPNDEPVFQGACSNYPFFESGRDRGGQHHGAQRRAVRATTYPR